MTRSIVRFMAAGMLLSVALATPGAAQTAAPDKKESAEKNDGDRALDTVENIATKPLKDLNIMKKKVPPELLEVMDNPYALKGIRKCSDFRREVNKLTAVLGPDVDSAEAQAASNKEQTAAEFVFGAAESVAGSLIPFSGVIRMISGASKRDNFAKAAVYAGSVRRAYLKGTARAKRCKI